ncbi:hypothetical protein PMA3_13720 [Pseudomonas silesiensis]|uniref:Uncharacterized protein n=1 Tax=Pseudomonas silesiensis TaxID=1853130 RepID=A0A191YTM7_9PSED|nr:hypothetical protein PMA3_13720 [Pseudomonas silesiensis]
MFLGYGLLIFHPLIDVIAQAIREKQPKHPRIRIMEMSSLSQLSYTNEPSSAFLLTLNQSPFTQQPLAGFSEQLPSRIE